MEVRQRVVDREVGRTAELGLMLGRDVAIDDREARRLVRRQAERLILE